MQATIEQNLELVRRRIAAAALRAGRSPSEIRLLGITKTHAAKAAAELFAQGVLDLGESRAADLRSKHAWFRARNLASRWHFVGHIQRNKARDVVECADVIHSVDSLRLLETLERIAQDVGRVRDVYLQVKLHPEANKSGLEPHEVASALARARASSSVRPIGLMTMAPLLADPAEKSRAARAVFHSLARLARELEHDAPAPLALSMGMSDDFEIAIEEGSTCVRIGGALFAGVEKAA